MLAHVFLLLFVVVVGAKWGCIWCHFFPKISLIDLSLLSLILTKCCPTVNFWPQYTENINHSYSSIVSGHNALHRHHLTFLSHVHFPGLNSTPYTCNQGGILWVLIFPWLLFLQQNSCFWIHKAFGKYVKSLPI